MRATAAEARPAGQAAREQMVARGVTAEPARREEPARSVAAQMAAVFTLQPEPSHSSAARSMMMMPLGAPAVLAARADPVAPVAVEGVAKRVRMAIRGRSASSAATAAMVGTAVKAVMLEYQAPRVLAALVAREVLERAAVLISAEETLVARAPR